MIQLGQARGPNPWQEKVCDRLGSFQHSPPFSYAYLTIKKHKFLENILYYGFSWFFIRTALKQDKRD